MFVRLVAPDGPFRASATGEQIEEGTGAAIFD